MVENHGSDDGTAEMDSIEDISGRAFETLAEVEKYIDELEAEVEELSDKQGALDNAAADFSNADIDSVHPEDAATHNFPALFVSEEQYNEYEDGNITAEELGAFPDDTVTTFTEYTGVIASLFTPRSRALLIDSWVREGEQPFTVTELAESSTHLTRQTVNAQIEPLLEHGFIIEGGKKGNAQTYQLNIRNPLVQTVHMLANIGRFGRTNVLLERDFLVPGPNGEGIAHDEKDLAHEE